MTLDSDHQQPDRCWPDGEVPYEVPAVWAASTDLLEGVDRVIADLNSQLDGRVRIRPRRSGDRDYLVLHITAKPDRCSGVELPGRQGGPQKLRCQVRSLVNDPTPIEACLMRELSRAIGMSSQEAMIASSARR